MDRPLLNVTRLRTYEAKKPKVCQHTCYLGANIWTPLTALWLEFKAIFAIVNI